MAKLKYVPVRDVHVMSGNYVEELAIYLWTEEWQATSTRAFLVIRNDIGAVYVFGKGRFQTLAVQSHKAVEDIMVYGANAALQEKLAAIFNIHEATRDAIVASARMAPGSRAAVSQLGTNAGLTPDKLKGVWVSQEEIAARPSDIFGDWSPAPRKERAGASPAYRHTDVRSPSDRSSGATIEEYQTLDPSSRAGPARRGGDYEVGRAAFRPFKEPGLTTEPPVRTSLPEREPVKAKIESAASPSETLRRTPHMNLSREDPFQTGDTFDVLVYLDEEASRPGEKSQDVVLIAPQDVQEFPLTVFLSTTNHFEIRGADRQEFVMKRAEAKSAEVKFSLVVVAEPASMRAATIVAAFDYEGRPCGKVTRSVVIGPRVTEAVGAKSETDPSEPAVSDSGGRSSRVVVATNARPADMTITILNPSRDRTTFEVTVKTPLLASYKKGVKKKWVLPGISSDVVKGYFQEFTRGNNTNKGVRDALNGAGKDLFETSPLHFKKAFWQIVDKGLPLKTISIVSEEPFIPWELMIPKRANDETRSALGATYAVGRWVCDDNVSPAQVLRLKDCRVVAPVYNGEEVEGQVVNPLPYADEEADFVLSKFSGHRIAPALYDTFDADMEAGGASLLHFVCHGAEQSAVAQRMHFEQSQVVSSLQIKGSDSVGAACKKHKPLVFLNACEVGRMQPALVNVGGFAQAFIDQGASAVIAPLWSVKDDIAHIVAKDFYDAIEKSPTRPFAEIIRDIRAKAYQMATVEDTYAAYCFYGDPLARRATPN
jgi:hypothetical protein